MKHTLSTIAIALLGVLATPVFAQNEIPLDFDKYSINFIEYTNKNEDGKGLGGYYTIKMKSAGSLFITNIFNTIYSGDQNELLTNSQYGITHIGYKDSEGVHDFAIGDTTRIEQFDSYNYEDNGTKTYYRDGYFLGNFEKDEEIEVYLARKDEEGNVLLWTATNSPQNVNGVAYVSRWGGRTDKLNSSMGVGQLNFPALGEKQINFGVIASTTRPIGGSSGTPSGSPLPGGLQIALIAGLFGLGFWYVRRRKATVA